MVVECIIMRPSVTVITEKRWQLLFWEHILLFHQQDMHSLMLSYNRYLMNVRGIKTISQDIPAWESVRIRCLFIVTGLSFFSSLCWSFKYLYALLRFFVRSERFFPHSLIVVGYGTDGYGWDYWRMKNSWGTQWGEDGYIRLYRGLGHCGAGSYVSQAVCQSSTSGYLWGHMVEVNKWN